MAKKKKSVKNPKKRAKAGPSKAGRQKPKPGRAKSRRAAPSKTKPKKLTRRNPRSRRSAPKKLGVGSPLAALGGDGTMDPPPEDDTPEEEDPEEEEGGEEGPGIGPRRPHSESIPTGSARGRLSAISAPVDPPVCRLDPPAPLRGWRAGDGRPHGGVLLPLPGAESARGQGTDCSVPRRNPAGV